MLKTYTNAGLIDYCNNNLLKVELSNLRHIGNKCDHPADGSKDIADAVCGSVFSCYQDIDHASQLSTKYKAQSYATAIQHRATNYSDDAFQQQIQGLY